MSKTRQEVEASLNITGNETLEQLLAKLESYVTISETELNNVKNISVQTLPTTVRGQEQLVKSRMTNPSLNDVQGVPAIINKRIVLIKLVLSKLLSDVLDTINTHTTNKNNPHEVSKSQLGLEKVVNTGDSATPAENGTDKFTTGGAYTELAKKLDKSTTSSSVYGVTMLGEQTMYGVGQSANNGSKIVQRTNTGQVNVPETPTANEHATSKKYVDGLNTSANTEINKKQAKNLTNSMTINTQTVTTVEGALSQLLTYVNMLDQIVSTIQGSGDTSLANTLAGLRTDITTIQNNWNTFMTGTSADNVINTLLEIQSELNKRNVIILSNFTTNSMGQEITQITQEEYNSITFQTTIVANLSRNNVSKYVILKVCEIRDNFVIAFSFKNSSPSYCYLYINSNDLYCYLSYTDILEKKVIKTSWTNSPSNNNIPSEKLVKETIDKETTKSFYAMGAFDEFITFDDTLLVANKTIIIDERYFRANCYFDDQKNLYILDYDDINNPDPQLVANVFLPQITTAMYSTNTARFWIYDNDCYTIGLYAEDIPNIEIQLKHDTSIVRKVIPDVPLINYNDVENIKAIPENTAKSLYHLGAFDSADGKTRQSWKISHSDLCGLTWQMWESGKFVAKQIFNAIIPTSSHLLNNIGYINDNSIWSNNKSIAFLDPTGSDYGLWLRNDDLTTLDAFKSWLSSSGLEIVYQLATSYTEQVIEGESILPLDTTMAQMIRQDVVDSLNLWNGFNTIKINTSTGAMTLDSQYLGTDYIAVKPNTTYTLSLLPTYTNHCVWYYTNSQVYIDRTSGDNIATRTFTTPSNCYYIAIGYTNSLTSAQVSEGLNSNIMLNSGSYPYPYSPHHANKHITDEEAELLKRETVKCRNLCSSFENATNYQANAYASLKPNTTYFFSSDDSTNVNVTFKIYDLSGTLLQTVWQDRYSNQVKLNAFDFTTNSSVNGAVRLQIGVNTQTSSMTWVMLNKGSEAEPYQEWYGEIVHKKELPHLYLHHLKVETALFATFEFTILSTSSTTITNFSDLFYTLSAYTGGLNKKVVVGMVELELNDTYHDRILFHAPEEADVDANTSDLEITDNKVMLF